LATALELGRADQTALQQAGRGRRRTRASGETQQPPAPLGAAVLATKLTPPHLRRELVERQRLITKLSLGTRGPLTVLSAPAGSGKTTTLSAWRNAVAGTGVGVAWVSLDRGDNDPVRFWSHVLVALDHLSPGVATASLAVLQQAATGIDRNTPPAVDAMLGALINRLSDVPDSLILVLDDYHEIASDEIHQGITFLLDHLPNCLHLLLGSRSDPPLSLAQLRVRGNIVEIRAADLRFTAGEAADFLIEVMRLPLTAAEVLALQTRTEGWIAGLQLAALALQARAGQSQTGSFVEAFTGSHRYVLDYLMDEVLSHQPADVLHFLLHTSVLERFCAPLCAAVAFPATEQQEAVPACHELLERLDHGNVFLITLDETRTWYRYHQLFADALQQRLQATEGPEQVAALHERAATWLEGEGSLAEAIGHALAAHAYDRAATLVERVAPDLLIQGEVRTIRQWLDDMPEATWAARPRLCLLRAWLVVDFHTLGTFEQYLRLAQKALQADPSLATPETRGELAGTQAILAMLAGRQADVIRFAEEALTLLSSGSMLRYVTHTMVASAYAAEGRALEAVRTFGQGVSAAYANGYIPLALMLIEDQTSLQRTLGRLTEAIETCREALRWADAGGARGSPFAAGPLRSLADLLCERYDLDEATQLMEEALRLDVPLAHAGTQMLNLLIVCRIRMAQGDLDGALLASNGARAAVLPGGDRGVVEGLWALIDGCEAQVRLAQGNLPAASALLDRHDVTFDPAFLSLSSQLLVYAFEHGFVPRIQLLLAQARAALESQPGAHAVAAPGPPPGTASIVLAPVADRTGDAANLLHQALQLLDQEPLDVAGVPMPVRHIKILILRALALDVLGAGDQAEAAMTEALAIAAPERYVRTFAEEGQLLANLLQRLRATCDRQHIPTGVPSTYLDTLLAACGASRG
jgi:LuxR family maltose regulon positive regulatory protein